MEYIIKRKHFLVNVKETRQADPLTEQQRIPSSETDVDKLKKYFGRKMDNSRENDGHVQLMSIESAKQYYENLKRENAERARNNTCIHLQQINFQNGHWKRTDSRVSIQPFTLKAN